MMQRVLHTLALGIVVCACEQHVVVGDPEDGGHSDARATADAGRVRERDAASDEPDACAACEDAGETIEGDLRHLHFTVRSQPAYVIPAFAQSMTTILVEGWDALPVERVRPSPLETFEQCEVFSGVSSSPEPTRHSVELGDNVAYSLDGGPEILIPRQEDTFEGRVYHSVALRPGPEVGTRIEVIVRRAGHEFHSYHEVMAIDFVTPTLTDRALLYNTEYRSGENFSVTWTPAAVEGVGFVGFRWAPTGVPHSSQVSCLGDTSTSGFSIPWRVFDTYLRPGAERPDGTRLESSIAIRRIKAEEETVGEVRVESTTTAQGREGVIDPAG